MLEKRASHFECTQFYLERDGGLEESYFTWSLIPIYNEEQQVAGIYSTS